jgi:hypothetical protein
LFKSATFGKDKGSHKRVVPGLDLGAVGQSSQPPVRIDQAAGGIVDWECDDIFLVVSLGIEFEETAGTCPGRRGPDEAVLARLGGVLPILLTPSGLEDVPSEMADPPPEGAVDLEEVL